MRLTASDVARLPLSCALFDRRGQVITATPEWRGSVFGVLVYEAVVGSLVVEPDGSSPDVDHLVGELIGEVLAATHHLGRPDRLSAEMLAAGLALVAGRLMPAEATGTTSDVVEYVREGARRSVSSVALEASPGVEQAVRAPAAIALALVQLVRNAARHSAAERVTLSVGRGPTFAVEWRADSAGVAITTARRPDQRQRWGLGMARLLADALGGVLTAPMPLRAGVVGSSIGFGYPRLCAPIASAVRGRIERASRPWDEETGLVPGAPLDPRLTRAVEAALARPGEITFTDIYRARAIGARVWLGIAPQSSLGRARDVLRGLQHEASLLAAPEPHATRIFALAAVLESVVSRVGPEPVSASTWSRDFQPACRALGVDPPPSVPADRLRYPDPRVTAYLIATLAGEVFESRDATSDQPDPSLCLRPITTSHLLARLLCNPEGHIVLVR